MHAALLGLKSQRARHLSVQSDASLSIRQQGVTNKNLGLQQFVPPAAPAVRVTLAFSDCASLQHGTHSVRRALESHVLPGRLLPAVSAGHSRFILL